MLEAAFLIALAVAAGLAELSATTIVLVMGAAWLLVAAIEWLAWRESPVFTRAVAEEPPQAAAPARRGRRFWRRRPTDEAPVEPIAVTPPAPAAEPGEDTQDLDAPAEQPAPVTADERTGT
jgi:hypothetical protein